MSLSSRMPKNASSLFSLLALSGAVVASSAFADRSDPRAHQIHDMDRELPPVVDPGPAGPPAPAPSDAIVLFDGTNFDHWQHNNGDEPNWKLVDGAMQVVPGAGDIRTRQTFGDAQLYVEFKLDPDSPGSGQSRSNSGVFFGSYEVQVLDTYANENRTYADGIAGSIYGQYPPLVNASRPADEWQSFNIVYNRPHFDDDGNVTQPARMTVFHNNVLVQYNEELIGPTSHASRANYSPHGPVPIRLQDHNDDPIFFRNIWVRELE